jgi:hypothetical protein
MLNPGDHFKSFGGSSRDLVPKKTASLVIRERIFGTISDVEYDIHDKRVWEWLARLINDKPHEVVATAKDLVV